MTQLMPPGAEIREADVTRPGGSRRYQVGADGAVTPASGHDRRVLAEAGWTQKPTVATFATAGRVCQECSFVGFFSNCGRCGGHCR